MGLVAKGVAIKRKSFLRYATGSIENSSGKKFSYLAVKLDLFDKNGKVIGSVLDGIENLGPGQTWNFETGISSGEAVTAKVGEIKGWF